MDKKSAVWSGFIPRLERIGMKIKGMRLVPKMFIGYVLLIVVPFTLFGYFYYSEMRHNFLQQYLYSEQQLLNQSYANLKINLSQAESAHQLFQNNVKLIEFLGGAYQTDWEMIYSYLKEIYPTFSFAYLSNPIVDEIRIFKYYESVLSLAPDIVDIDELKAAEVYGAIAALPPNEGIWMYTNGASDQMPTFQYYHKLYTNTFSKELGVIKISVGGGILEQFVNTLADPDGDLNVFLIDRERGGRVVYSRASSPVDVDLLTRIGEDPRHPAGRAFYTDDSRHLVNSIDIEPMGLLFVEISDVAPLMQTMDKRERWMIAAGAVLLAGLSALYYVLAASVTRRIIRLSRHMRRVDERNFAPYAGSGGLDEIGFLISSYNAMIANIDELVNTVHRTELMKKEADFRMLQAQIKPHFLYNTLEAMRMQAAMNEDREVAEMAGSLGNLLRYSLSGSEKATLLRDEIEHVEHYIAIQKIRMGDRLHVEWDVQEGVADYACPRFIVQPLVENAIQHGLANLRRPGLIRIRIEWFDPGVRVMIEDNGAGIPGDKLVLVRRMLDGEPAGEDISRRGGIGLHNVNERIKAYYGPPSGIVLDSAAGEGTTCTMILAGREA